MPKALIAPMTLANLDGAFKELLREAGFELVYPSPKRPHQLSEDELLHSLNGVFGVLAGSEPYTRRVIIAHPALRIIARAGVGYDAVDVEAATERGVAVAIAPGTNQDAVAEHTFSLILALAKYVAFQHPLVKAGQWPRQATLPLRGRTLGIAGLGRIGKAVALRGEAFRMPLLAYEPVPDKQFTREHNIQLVPFEQLLRESDYLTLHVPLLPESRYMINRETLALMKPTAFLINTARGGLVNENDLVEALRNKRIAGAALDVFEQEPPVKDHPLFGFDNVVLTPHAAGVDLQSRDEMALSAARAIVALSKGEWPAEQIVNPEVRAKFR
jgi:D-3-phosphoglycerate dehydrogenase